MNSVEIRQMIEQKREEMRGFLDTNKLDEAEKAGKEKRELERKLEMTETLENEEKRELEKQEKVEERKDVVKMEENKKIVLTEEEVRSFAEFVRGEKRALSAGDNGGVIPVSISSQILEKVKELSPIYSLATVYNVSGDLVLPRYDEATSSISASYIDEFTELTEGTGKFTTIKLENFIIGVLAKISKSLINRSDFDLTNFVINEVAKKIAEFIEKELIVGTTNKIQGVLTSTNTLDTETASTIKADDIIELEAKIPDLYLANAVFIMNKKTRTAVKKLKDGQGNYLLQRDFAMGSQYNLLGHPVYISENMPVVADGAKAIVFGDMTGLAVKLTNNIESTVLTEKYATQYAVGVCAYIEMDADVQDAQKIAVLKVKSAS